MSTRGGATGFTIIEVMIFLAVSAAMFISVVVLFGGVQQRQQFSQSMRDIDSRFQDIINDVATGYFDELKDYTCTAGDPPYFSASTGASQGTNKGCIFLGKAVLLAPGGNKNTLEISPVVGRRLDSDSQDVTAYSAASPTTVFDSGVDLTTVYNINWGAEIISARFGNKEAYASGFYGSLATRTSGGAIKSGSQRVRHFQHLLRLGTTRADLKTCIEDNRCFEDAVTEPWVICFDSGAGQTAQLSIGGNGTLTTKLEFIDC